MIVQTLRRPATEPTRHRFTVEEFMQMHEAGILAESGRVELLEGEVYDMSPVGPLHSGMVNLLTQLLSRAADDKALISVQNPIVLDEHNQPEPDIALLVPRDDYYKKSHPRPHEVLLLVEVSRSSLAYDRQQKLPLYASAGVPEVWLVDLDKQQVEQFSEPLESQYTRHLIVPRGKQLAATLLPQISFTTDRLFS